MPDAKRLSDLAEELRTIHRNDSYRTSIGSEVTPEIAGYCERLSCNPIDFDAYESLIYQGIDEDEKQSGGLLAYLSQKMEKDKEKLKNAKVQTKELSDKCAVADKILGKIQEIRRIVEEMRDENVPANFLTP